MPTLRRKAASLLVDERIVLPRAGDPSYKEELVAAAHDWRCDVVHPQADAEVLALGSVRDSLSAVTHLPSQATLELAADKLALADRLRRASVVVPEAVACKEFGDIGVTTEKLLASHERVLVRARSGVGARASLPVRSGSQAEAWVRWWVSERGLVPSDFMISEFFPGREFAYQSVWQDGELVVGQTRERIEYLFGHFTPSGQTSTPAIARTVRLPAVDDTALSAIRALDPNPSGVYCVDLKESSRGAPKITEINAGVSSPRRISSPLPVSTCPPAHAMRSRRRPPRLSHRRSIRISTGCA